MAKDKSHQDERRKYLRFHDIFFGNAEVCLEPVPPLFGDSARGCLIDLSAGGMALLLTEVLPKNLLLKMTLTLPDGFVVDSVVRVCRISACGATGFLHGIEFLNPCPEAAARIDLMAQDSITCSERIARGEPKVCQNTCSLIGVCKRIQCEAKSPKPVEMTFQRADGSTWQSFKEEFSKHLKAA
jgi:hypothetical protein